MKRTILLVFVVLMSYTPTFSSGGDKLLKNFQNLPEDQRMAVYWYWMSDNIS